MPRIDQEHTLVKGADAIDPLANERTQLGVVKRRAAHSTYPKCALRTFQHHGIVRALRSRREQALNHYTLIASLVRSHTIVPAATIPFDPRATRRWAFSRTPSSLTMRPAEHVARRTWEPDL